MKVYTLAQLADIYGHVCLYTESDDVIRPSTQMLFQNVHNLIYVQCVCACYAYVACIYYMHVSI